MNTEPEAKIGHRIVSIFACSRCGQDHKDLTFAPFVKPPIFFTSDGGTVEWTHWALCPTLGEPILMVPDPIVRLTITAKEPDAPQKEAPPPEAVAQPEEGGGPDLV